jgi:hypothetical protein
MLCSDTGSRAAMLQCRSVLRQLAGFQPRKKGSKMRGPPLRKRVFIRAMCTRNAFYVN